MTHRAASARRRDPASSGVSSAAGAVIAMVRRWRGRGRSAARCGAGAQQPPPGAVRVVGQAAAAAHPGVGQHELARRGGLVVAGQLGGDAADLLVPGHREERRRAPVGLHPDQVQAGLGVGQVGGQGRGGGAAGVHVRVDVRRDPPGRLQHRVQVEPHLGTGTTGPAGTRSAPPRRRPAAAPGRPRPQHRPPGRVQADALGAEPGHQPDQAVLRRPAWRGCRARRARAARRRPRRRTCRR